MNISRRKFIYTSAITATVGASILPNLTSCRTSPKGRPFGIQLWTVKEDMEKDPVATLNFLSDFGYTQVESFTGSKGIFWGFPPKEFGKILGDINVKMISSHVDPKFTVDPQSEDEWKKLCEDALNIGVKCLLNPYPGPQKSSDDWKVLAEGLNRQGEISRSIGIRTGYHNHHHEFALTPEGDVPLKILLEGTDPALVDFELDLYWAVKAGQDPNIWFSQNPNRFVFAHFKDLYKLEKVKEIESAEKQESPEWPVGASTWLGNGQIDFAKILETGEANGLSYFLVEQERFDHSTPLDDSKKDAEFMRKLLAVKA